MTTQDENLLVKLIKKSVGLPTGQSCGCGAAPAPGKAGGAASAGCCDDEASKEATERDNTEAQAEEKVRPNAS